MSQEWKDSWIPGLPPAGSPVWVDTQIQEDRTIRVNLEQWSLVLRSAGNRARVEDTRTQAGTMSREVGDRKNQASRLADTLDRDSRLVPADRMSRENLDTSDQVPRPAADTQARMDTRTQADTMSRE
jgi:hypothetical protein